MKRQYQKYGPINYIPRPVQYYQETIRLNKKIAGKFHLKAREIQLTKGPKYLEWAYRKSAWSLDELASSVFDMYKQDGLEGIIKIKDIGEKIGKQIIKEL